MSELVSEGVDELDVPHLCLLLYPHTYTAPIRRLTWSIAAVKMTLAIDEMQRTLILWTGLFAILLWTNYVD